MNDQNYLPVFYLCENGLEGKTLAAKNYLKEHTNYFIEKCIKYKIVYHLEILPKSRHDKNYGLHEVFEKFECFTPPDRKYIQIDMRNLKDLDKKSKFKSEMQSLSSK